MKPAGRFHAPLTLLLGVPLTVLLAASSHAVAPVDPRRPTTAPPAVVRAFPVQRNLTTDLGGMITLLCQAPSNMTILGVRWTRPDLNPKHVLSLQDGQLDLINQHPSFRNRVELVSRQLTNGDLSLVLKDVRAGDRGTYECRYRGRRGAVSVESEPVSLINLTASQSDDATSRQARGHTAVIVTLSVIGVVALLAAVVAVVISRKCRRHSPQQN